MLLTLHTSPHLRNDVVTATADRQLTQEISSSRTSFMARLRKLRKPRKASQARGTGVRHLSSVPLRIPEKRRQSIRDRVELPPQRNVSEHCGTVYGARQHREIFRESACDDCLKAEARYRKSRTRPPTMQVEVDFVVELLFSATDPVYRKIEKRYGEKKIQKLIADYESRQDARNDRVR